MSPRAWLLDAWDRTATVTDMIGKRIEYSTLYYGDWMPRHECSHLGQMRRVLGAATSRS